MKTLTKTLLLSTSFIANMSIAQQSDELQATNQLNYSFTGDETRLGVGITDEGEFMADFLKSFGSTYRSNWMGQAWYSNKAGGFELDYHWINAAQSEEDLFNQGLKISKLSFAVDQNAFHDRKFTLGYGREGQNNFWSINGSKAITGTRLVSDTSVFTEETINGFLGNHATTQLRTIEDITRVFQHPYDWGVGGRIGKYFDNSLLRLTGGLDFEQGKFNSDQLSASIDLEKYFNNSGHSVALHLEQLKRNGDFTLAKNDTRASLLYRYDFGKTFAPTERYEEVKVVDEEALAKLKAERRQVIQNNIDLSSEAFFDLDKYQLREDTKTALLDVVNKIKQQKLVSKITIIGHTCYLGSQSHNQTLSENRANAAKQFFANNGIDANQIITYGKGESEPAYDNHGPEIAKNRRVVVNFLTTETDFVEVEIPTEDVPVKWVKKPVKVAPSWLARALRNPTKHKRTVDVYRYEETEQKVTLGDVIVLNEAPNAVDNEYTFQRNTQNNAIDVLANDSDSENDTLSITNVTQPANGTIINNGTILIYTPNTGYIGTETFQYTIDDGNGAQDSATVTLNVLNIAPIANDDSATTFTSDAVIINLLDNDTDADGDQLTIESFTQGQFGTVSNNQNGTVTYKAHVAYVGTDTFSYTISDADGAQSSATVTVTVNEDPVPNNPPVAIDDTYNVMINGSLDFNPLTNDSDPDFDTLTVISIDTSQMTGTVSYDATGAMHYEPAPDFHGVEEFTYTIDDGRGGTATATVMMCVFD